MKLRKPWMIRLGARLGSRLIRLWAGTLRVRADALGQQTNPWDATLQERFIYAFWHENLAAVAAVSSVLPVTALISQSSDGELLSRICQLNGLDTIRGSSTRGGLVAVDQLLETAQRSHLLIAPDGPQGPCREVKRGLVYLAAWSKVRIVPLGVAFGRAYRVKSWDRTKLPWPGTRLSLVAGPIISIPAGLGKAAMEAERLRIEASINTATGLAEAWAQKNVAPKWPDAVSAAA